MNIVVYLSSKYLKFKASERGISAIAVIALFTIIVSTAAAIVILSASNGFHENFKKKLMAKDAHLTVMGADRGVTGYDAIIEQVTNIKGVVQAVPYLDRQALIRGRYNTYGALVKGIPAELPFTDKDFSNQFRVMEGGFNFTEPRAIILGESLANNLGAVVGGTVDLTVYSEEFFTVTHKFIVRGLFSAGYSEYDANLAFISFRDAQEVFDSMEYATGIGIKVQKPFEVEHYIKPVQKAAANYSVWNWKNLNRNNIIALENEKMLVYIILSVFFIVVGFNILSTMIAMVMDKKTEIGILKAMGLSPGSTLKVFLLDGFLLGAVGSAIGVVAGVLLTMSLNTILRFIERVIDLVNISAYWLVMMIKPVVKPAPFKFFKESVYYISEFPIRLEYADLAFVIFLAITLATLAVIIPALRAARLRPVEVLRND